MTTHVVGFETLGREDTAVAGGKGTSFACMNATYTDIVGDNDVIERVRDCWASLFSPRVIAYRTGRRIFEEPAIAVVVQRMVGTVLKGHLHPCPEL